MTATARRTPPRVAIIGSGIAGTLVAGDLMRRGFQVVMLEKGPAYPYPHQRQFAEEILYGHTRSAGPPADLRKLTSSGSYRRDIDAERVMVVGGGATRWGAMTDRMHPHDFSVRRRYGFAADWPLDYASLEPFYAQAERLLGVSGSTQDDPHPTPRSSDYPLPAFPFSHDVRTMVERLRTAGIALFSSPQARTRRPFDDRPACANFGTCAVCPIGARYSPNHHLARLMQQRTFELRVDTAVRRVLVDRRGQVRGVLVRSTTGTADEEIPADVVVLAAGAIESVRLLLLSRYDRFPDGLGNQGGQLGQHFLFHHIWAAHLDFASPVYSGRTGPEMAQSRQFLDPPGRGRHGGVLLQLPSTAFYPFHPVASDVKSGPEVLAQLRPRLNCQLVWIHAESAPAAEKQVRLATERDRFGDPVAQAQYSPTEFDAETYRYGATLLERLAQGTGARDFSIREPGDFSSGCHHMGGCRMGRDPRDSVVDADCRVHGTSGLYVVGSSVFPSSSAVHPTLTIAALALRTAGAIAGVH
jgi:choline dehydrogenase-like flavoprotein